jgi:hypothetical protein
MKSELIESIIKLKTAIYMWYAKIIFRSILLTTIVVSFCCNNTSIENKTVSKEKKTEKESFDIFFNKFYQDTGFQISRIKFPLKGFYMTSERIGISDSLGTDHDNFEWDKEKWMNTPSVSDTDTMEYKINRIITDTIITREIIAKKGNMKIVEKYKLIDDKWFLVHYVFWFL